MSFSANLSIYSELKNPDEASATIALLQCLSEQSSLSWELTEQKTDKKPLLELFSKNDQIHTRFSTMEKTEEKILTASTLSQFYCEKIPVLLKKEEPQQIQLTTNHDFNPSTIPEKDLFPKEESFLTKNWPILTCLGVIAGGIIYFKSKEPKTRGITVSGF